MSARPRVDLAEIGPAEIGILEQLAQLYQYDFSGMDPSDPQHGHIGPDGRFGYIQLDGFFDNERHHAFLVKVNGRIGGFVLVAYKPSFRDAAEHVWWVDEFFVMRKYRRLGVGAEVARRIFDAFPGTWQVAEMDINTGAQAFWRTVIGAYTGGRFEETVMDDEQWLGPVQYFRSDGAGPAGPR